MSEPNQESLKSEFITGTKKYLLAEKFLPTAWDQVADGNSNADVLRPKNKKKPDWTALLMVGWLTDNYLPRKGRLICILFRIVASLGFIVVMPLWIIYAILFLLSFIYPTAYKPFYNDVLNPIMLGFMIVLLLNSVTAVIFRTAFKKD